MSLITLEYRADQRRRILTRSTLRFFLPVAAVILLVLLGIYFYDATGTPHTTVFSFFDARTNAPIPITVMITPLKGPDPWQKKITAIKPNVMQVQWVQQKTPGTIIIASPGYQGIGINLGRAYPAKMSIGLWPTPPAAAPPVTQSSSSPNPTANN